MADFLIPPRDLLSFYAEAGVDAAVGETPNDYLSAPPISPSAAPAGTSSAQGTPIAPMPRKAAADIATAAPIQNAPAVPETAVMAAREAAKTAASLDELRTLLDRFDGCALKATASRLVFADGNPEGRVMFVGEAPGRDEDIEGLPFVGRSGKLLDQMLKAIGLDRTKVYIANIVPWRPPGNRTPTPVETQICLPFIQRQIELADPDILVCVGGPSAGGLLNMQGILKNRGRWVTYNTGTREIRAMATLHPAYLLRSPIAKRLAWRDFLAIKRALG
jgi:uracil-DNA glycosylase